MYGNSYHLLPSAVRDATATEEEGCNVTSWYRYRRHHTLVKQSTAVSWFMSFVYLWFVLFAAFPDKRIKLYHHTSSGSNSNKQKSDWNKRWLKYWTDTHGCFVDFQILLSYPPLSPWFLLTGVRRLPKSWLIIFLSTTGVCGRSNSCYKHGCSFSEGIFKCLQGNPAFHATNMMRTASESH